MCRPSKSPSIFIPKSLRLPWEYLETFGFQVIPSDLEEFYSEEYKLSLEIYVEQFESAREWNQADDFAYSEVQRRNPYVIVQLEPVEIL